MFCAVLAWSRFRFVRFAPDEQQTTMLAMLAKCFEEFGGVPKVVLADRMACLKGRWSPAWWCRRRTMSGSPATTGSAPTSVTWRTRSPKGIVENLVGYAKDDLLVPLELDEDPSAGGNAGLNERAKAWVWRSTERRHSEIHAVPAERLTIERELPGELASLRLEVGPASITRKVDKL